MDLARKDLSFAHQMGREFGVPLELAGLTESPRPSGVMSSKPQSGLAKSPERWCWPGGDFEKLISLPPKWRYFAVFPTKHVINPPVPVLMIGHAVLLAHLGREV